MGETKSVAIQLLQLHDTQAHYPVRKPENPVPAVPEDSVEVMEETEAVATQPLQPAAARDSTTLIQTATAEVSAAEVDSTLEASYC